MQEEMSCAACGFANNVDHRFCRRCGSLLEEFTDEPEQKLELALATAKAKKAPFTLIELIIVIAIVGILVAIAIPNTSRRGSRGTSRMKACFANQRVLLGALEMYNMDNEKMITHMDKAVVDKLVEGKYLKFQLECPASPPGEYVSTGDLSREGTIRCSTHGSPENPINPDY